MKQTAFLRTLVVVLAWMATGTAVCHGEVEKTKSGAVRLKTYSQWLAYCGSSQDAMSVCLDEPNQKTGRRTRRGADIYTLPAITGDPIMTRSGVLLAPDATRDFDAVLSDRASMSIVETRSGAHCLMYSAYGRSGSGLARETQLNSFVRYLNDTASEQAELYDMSSRNSRTELYFSSKAKDLYGALISDEVNNADIWLACVNAPPALLASTTFQLSKLILGSGRQYW